MGDSAFIWTAGNVVDNPVGEGKAFVSNVTFDAQVNNSVSNVAKVKAFVIADLKKFNALTEAMEITK